MATENKTKRTDQSVDSYIDAIADPARREDCRQLAAIMKRVTGCEPYMFGTSIVGFDTYHYKYESGHEGYSCVAGFSSRTSDISIYLVGGYADDPDMREMLTALGKHKASKGCLYIKRMSEVKPDVLEKMITWSAANVRRMYPTKA